MLDDKFTFEKGKFLFLSKLEKLLDLSHQTVLDPTSESIDLLQNQLLNRRTSVLLFVSVFVNCFAGTIPLTWESGSFALSAGLYLHGSFHLAFFVLWKRGFITRITCAKVVALSFLIASISSCFFLIS